MSQKRKSALNGIILAGGLSSRFGSCKSRLSIDGKSILENTYTLLMKYCSSVAISCHEDRKIEGYPCIYDIKPCYAPIIGIYSALIHFKSPILVLSCDLPFIDENAIQRLIITRNKVIQIHKQLFMTTYYIDKSKSIEPLIAIYEYESLKLLEKALEEEKYTLHKVISEENQYHIITDEKKAFFNINFPEDLQRAKELYVR